MKKTEVKNGTFERFRVELIKVYLALDCLNLFSNLKKSFSPKNSFIDGDDDDVSVEKCR